MITKPIPIKMKTKDEATWLFEANVWYTYDSYLGARPFYFFRGDLTSGQTVARCIYGVSIEEGRRLIDSWNNQLSKTWQYREDTTKNANVK